MVCPSQEEWTADLNSIRISLVQILVVGESKVPRFQAYDYTGVLWFNDQQRPSWVEVEMAVIAPGTLYLTVFHGIEVLQVLWHQNMRRQQRFSNKCNMKA
jgi:hypothetical protein